MALYEPFPSAALLRFFRKFIRAGGRVIWSSVPPLPARAGGKNSGAWAELFGLADYANNPDGAWTVSLR